MMSEGDSAANGASAASGSEVDAKKVYFNINVVDPVKQDANGLNPYVTYKVNTTTDDPRFPEGQCSVIRRFKDFTWLSDCLLEEFPGVICPPVPDKETVKKFDAEFIEKRRVELEKFLLKVSTHEELKRAEALFTFLKADDATLAKKKTDSTVLGRVTSGPANSGNEIKRQFGWMMTNIKAQMGQQTSKKFDEDEKVDAINIYISELDSQVQLVAKHIGQLVKKQESLGSTAYDLGFALTQLAKAERDNEPLKTMLEQSGEKVDGASVTLKVKAQKDAESFEGPILEYVKIISSVKTAIAKRNEKRLLYIQAMDDKQTKINNHAKLQETDAKPEKMNVALAAVKSAEDAEESAKRTYQAVTERLVREFERFNKEKSVDLKKMLQGFVTAHIECNRLEEEHWQQMLSAVEGTNCAF